MDDEELATELARAGLGVNYWILGHAHHGWLGIIKDAFVMREAAMEIPPGPLEDQLRAAGRIMNSQGGDIDELHVDVTVRGLGAVKEAGASIMEAVAPTLTGLAGEEAEQVQTWLMQIARRMAEASRDRFRGARVSEDEEQAMAALRGWLDDPAGPPLHA